MIFPIEKATSEVLEKVGLKGACLGDMKKIGFDVPPGFVISTDVCREFFNNEEALPDGFMDEVKDRIKQLEQETGRNFGGTDKPLLLSVRSGAAVSMPGMMETLLNLGLNHATIRSLIAETKDERFVYDCLRRFLRMYGVIIHKLDRREFDRVQQYHLDRTGGYSLEDLDSVSMKRIGDRYLSIMKKFIYEPIPEDPYEQLNDAIVAVLKSWNSPRSRVYRNLRRIRDDAGTAVIIQSMVFGNFGLSSAVGNLTTRDPLIGNKQLFGEYLAGAQGEEIQEGARVPRSILGMKEEMPEIFSRLSEAAGKLERYYRSVQEIEFTVEKGRLFFLQTRKAECTARATIKTSVDMVTEGLISKEEALMRVKPESLGQMLFRYIDPSVQARSLVRGQPASPGAAYGLVAFSVEKVKEIVAQNKEVILVRPEATPEDMLVVDDINGLLVIRGSLSSHALSAVRKAGKPCVSGCPGVELDLNKKEITVGNTTIKEESVITIDGSTGRVFVGTVKMWDSTMSDEFMELLSWADEARSLGVRANADTPDDVKRAMDFGAEGIGLCRTEAMFMAADRLPIMQTLVLAGDQPGRDDLLERLQEVQKQDFKEMFRLLDGKPVTFRLLDPPLHEFMPALEPLMMDVYEMRAQGIEDEARDFKEALLTRVLSHKEVNPMLGLRGCRMAILAPELARMQAVAVFEAACEIISEGIKVQPEILIPLVGHVNELIRIRKLIDDTAQLVMEEKGIEVKYKVGVLIEIPRAALTAGSLAKHSDFFSFGTNDLTQTTFGLSRDDSEQKFLVNYLDQGVLEDNPFQVLDPDGVGRLVRMSVEEGRASNPGLAFSLCGEHGTDPRTVFFCHALKIDTVSCSPYQVPIARLAAAQARIVEQRNDK